MPVFRYQCGSCGLNFSARVAGATNSTKCESCGAPAEKTMPRGFSVTSSVATEGLSAPMSGISSHDYQIDRIVGEDSKTKWKTIASRQKAKRDVIEASGKTGYDLAKKIDGSYGVMTPKQRAASERTRSFHSKMEKALREKFPQVSEHQKKAVLRP